MMKKTVALIVALVVALQSLSAVGTIAPLPNEIEGFGPGGNAKIGKHEYGIDYPPMRITHDGQMKTCYLENSAVKTLSMNNKLSVPNDAPAYSFPCSTNSGGAVNGGYSTLNDGHAYTTLAIEMFNKWYNVDPHPTQLVVRVNYGVNYEGGFFNGWAFTNGDGGNTYYPFNELDGMGHEVAHAFTMRYSKLSYAQPFKQSAGVNEAYSDFAGEAVKVYVRGSNDYMLSAEIYKKVGGARRYLCDPKRDGKSIENIGEWVDGMDPHRSSGIFNKASCKISQSPGWNVKHYFGVLTRANKLYWKSDSTFTSAACDIYKASQDLGYGSNAIVTEMRNVGIDLTRECIPLADMIKNAGACCVGYDAKPGCSRSATIEAAVCEKDSYCCSTSWDISCAHLVSTTFRCNYIAYPKL